MLRIFLTGLALACLLAATAFAETPAPAEPIKEFNEALITAMKRAEELGFDGRKSLIGEAYDNVFAYGYMARIAVGRNWREFSETQQTAYVEAYRDWSVSTYASRFDSYKDQEFRIESVEMEDDAKATVTSEFVKPDGETIDFLYQMRKAKDGRWLVVDIKIKGVSQLANTRAQFVTKLETDGFKGLMELLESKTATMAG
jgi:phospholipid transport system substrate-binding protein